MRRPCQPALRALGLGPVVPEAVLVGGRRVDDAGDVARFRQQEALLPAKQLHALPGALPEGDVIVHRRHQQHRGLHLAKIDAGVADLELPLHQLVLQVETAQQAVVGLARHIGAVAVPVQQIEGHRALALEVAVDVVVPVEAVLPQQAEGDSQLAPVHDALGLILRLERRYDGLVDEDAKLPGLGEVQQGGEQGGGAHPLLLAPRRQPAHGERQGGAADAVADAVHLPLAGGRLHAVQGGDDAIHHVVVEIDLGLGHARVAPGDHEHRLALGDQPGDQGVLGPHVHDVVLVDEGRHYQHRCLAHRLGSRAVLNELIELGALHHPARGGRQIPAELEGGFVGQADVELIGAALQILGQEGQPAHQVLAVGLQGQLEQLGVGRQEVAGGHGVDVLAGEETQPLPALLGDALQGIHRGQQVPGGEQVGLLEVVIDGLFAPGLGLEAAIAALRGDHRLARLACAFEQGVLHQLELILPPVHLGLDQLPGLLAALLQHLAQIVQIGLQQRLGGALCLGLGHGQQLVIVVGQGLEQRAIRWLAHVLSFTHTRGGN
ncbi:hypothetical protein D3C86_711340 [compost metagenome]